MPAFSNVAGDTADPKFFELVVRGKAPDDNGNDRPAFQVYRWFKKTNNAANPTETALQGLIMAIIAGPMGDCLSDEYVPLNAKARYMDDPESPVVEGDAADAGAISGDRAPLYEAVTMRAVVDARGRHFRSNKHFSPIAESATTQDKIATASLTVWNALKTALNAICEVEDAGGNIWQHVVLSASRCQLQDSPTEFFGAYITSYTLNGELTTMTRRKIRSAVTLS